MRIPLFAAFAIAALAALFATQNAQHTQVSFLTWYFEAPLVMILLITFAAGSLTAFLAMLPASVRKSLEIKRLKSKPAPPPLTGTEQTPPPVNRKEGGSHPPSDTGM
jgi:uncharacterized integral membrane protein